MKESQIQKSIVDYLQYLENQKKLWFTRTGSGCIQTKSGGWFKTGKPGCPDIIICIDGLFCACEIKAPKGKQSPVQKEAQKAIEWAGGHYYVVRSVLDVEYVLKEMDSTIEL